MRLGHFHGYKISLLLLALLGTLKRPDQLPICVRLVKLEAWYDFRLEEEQDN